MSQNGRWANLAKGVRFTQQVSPQPCQPTTSKTKAHVPPKLTIAAEDFFSRAAWKSVGGTLLHRGARPPDPLARTGGSRPDARGRVPVEREPELPPD